MFYSIVFTYCVEGDTFTNSASDTHTLLRRNGTGEGTRKLKCLPLVLYRPEEIEIEKKKIKQCDRPKGKADTLPHRNIVCEGQAIRLAAKAYRRSPANAHKRWRSKGMS